MPLVENNLYFWAEVTLANLSDATTETLYLINRESALSPFFNDQARPLIVSIQGIGSEMRLDVPTSVTGSLVLDNTPGSFSYERRLSDLFERKTPVNQQVVFKTKVSTSTEDTISGGETLLTTICSSWQADPSANMLRLELESEPISRRIVTKQITTDAFPLAPQSSIGKTLPVVFGQDVEVRPFAVDQTTTPNTNDYAYATELNTKFVVGGFQTMFARNIFGTYTQLAAHTDFNVPVYVQADSGIFVNTNAWNATEVVELVYPIQTAGVGHVITGGRVWFETPAGAPAPNIDGEFLFRIYQIDPRTNLPERTLATGEVVKVDIQGQILTPGVPFLIEFTLSNPVVIDTAEEFRFALGIENTYSDTNTLNDCRPKQSPGFAGPSFYAKRYSSNSVTAPVGREDRWQVVPQSPFGVTFAGDFYAVQFIDIGTTPFADADGFRARRLQSGARPYTGSGTNSEPDIGQLDIVAAIDGLQDDSLGSVTGTPNLLITRPDHALNLLSYRWFVNGLSDWSAPEILLTDYTTELNNLYASDISINGRTVGRKEFRSVVEEIAANTGARVFLRNDELQLFARGTKQDSITRITDEHAVVTTVFSAGANTQIFNRVEQFFDKRLTDTDLTTSNSEGALQDYAGSITIDRSTEPLGSILENSELLYGLRSLRNNTLDWLSDAASAGALSELYLRSEHAEKWYCRFIAPFYTGGAMTVEPSALQIGDVIEIVHPDLPAFFGTSAAALEPTFAGEYVRLGGMRVKRANNYRAQIEGVSVLWSEFQTPAINFLVRLLINENEVI